MAAGLLGLAALLIGIKPAKAQGTGTNPNVHTITVTADLPSYDPAGGDGVTKTVYLNNSAPGVLALTFDIRGTPPLTLTAGPAFGDGAQTFTTTATPWTQVVTYSVETGSWSYPDVAYLATNATNTQTLVSISYVRDVLAPNVTIATPQQGAVFTTAHLPAVSIAGTASDGGSGLDRVEVSAGAGWLPVVGTANWSYSWPLPDGADHVPYTWRARATDRVANQGLSQNVVVTVDTVAREAAVPQPHRSPWVTSTVIYDWPNTPDEAGIARYQVRITNSQGYANTFSTLVSAYTFQGASAENVPYSARVQAIDRNGNVGPWSGASVVTPDLHRPTITAPGIDIILNPDALYASGLTLYYTNTMGESSFGVIGNATDALSGLDRVRFSHAFGQTPPDDTTPSFYTGVYDVPAGATGNSTIIATAYDRAGNRATQAYRYELDGTAPDATASAPGYVTSSPIAVTWTATDTQSGILSVTLWYSYAGSWRASGLQEQTSTYHQDLAGTFYLARAEDGTQDGRYCFAVVAQDNLHNRRGGPPCPPTPCPPNACTLYNTRVPQSEVTWAPAYKNSSPITVTWVATPWLAALTEVRLWVRFDNGTWKATNLVSDQTSGVFTFDPPDGDGAYDLATVAQDELGASEADPMSEPFGHGDATTVFDTIDPTDVTITAPEHSVVPTFPVSWSASDATSGIAFYTVAYSGTAYTDWQPWLAHTTLTSAVFDAPETKATYILSVTAYDRAGNHAQDTTTTRVGVNDIYLPLALKNQASYFEGPWEVEPNNAYAQANGPLRTGRNYYGHPNDAWDYFTICPRAPGNATIDLTNHTGQGVQLQLRDQAQKLLAYVYRPPYHIDYAVSAGCYSIGIYTASGYSSATPYTLRVTYP